MPFDRPRSADRTAIEWNSAVCSIRCHPHFVSPTTCERIARLAAEFPEEVGALVDAHPGSRRSGVRWLPLSEKTRWAYELMRHLIDEANERFMFDITGFAEPLHTVEYGVDGHIGWHLDCALRQTSTRKLAATLLLTPRSDFEGGEIEFAAQAEKGDEEDIGDARVFPTYLAHRVLPVTRGRRQVLVAWAHGPSFK